MEFSANKWHFHIHIYKCRASTVVCCLCLSCFISTLSFYGDGLADTIRCQIIGLNKNVQSVFLVIVYVIIQMFTFCSQWIYENWLVHDTRFFLCHSHVVFLYTSSVEICFLIRISCCLSFFSIPLSIYYFIGVAKSLGPNPNCFLSIRINAWQNEWLFPSPPHQIDIFLPRSNILQIKSAWEGRKFHCHFEILGRLDHFFWQFFSNLI